jgi:acetolactate synthase regulatory subunit
MACIIPGMAVDRHDMRRAIEAAVAGDRAIDLLTKCVMRLPDLPLRYEIIAFLAENA